MKNRIANGITWDIYTIIIVALIPVILVAAWGMSWWNERELHAEQCSVALEWLQESEDLLPLYERADTMADIDPWINSIDALNSPSSAGTLRWGILQSARYFLAYYPNVRIEENGELNPADGIHSRDIIGGTEQLIDHCPEVAPLLPVAFPMIFTQEPVIE
ncbi:MAG: hypothetical protein KC435_03565 [Thermomicrobiales bacterium]|nr:hypothetical protein [Thermomicrobiales bacterium]